MQLSHLMVFCVCVFLDISRCERVGGKFLDVKNVDKLCIISKVCCVVNFATSAECVEVSHLAEDVTTIKLSLGDDCSVLKDAEDQPPKLSWFKDGPVFEWILKCRGKKVCQLPVADITSTVFRVGALLTTQQGIPLAVLSSCLISLSSDMGSVIQQGADACQNEADLRSLVVDVEREMAENATHLGQSIPATLISQFQKHWITAEDQDTPLHNISVRPTILEDDGALLPEERQDVPAKSKQRSKEGSSGAPTTGFDVKQKDNPLKLHNLKTDVKPINSQMLHGKLNADGHVRGKRSDPFTDEVLPDVVPNIYIASDQDVKDVLFDENDDSSDIFSGELNPNDRIWSANDLPNNYAPVLSFPDEYFESTFSATQKRAEEKNLAQIKEIASLQREIPPKGNIFPPKSVGQQATAPETQQTSPEALEGRDMLESMEEDIEKRITSSFDTLINSQVAEAKHERKLVSKLARKNQRVKTNALDSLEKGTVNAEGVDGILYPTDDDEIEVEAAAISAVAALSSFPLAENASTMATPSTPSPSPSPLLSPPSPPSSVPSRRTKAEILPSPDPELDWHNTQRWHRPPTNAEKKRKSWLELKMLKKLEQLDTVNGIKGDKATQSPESHSALTNNTAADISISMNQKLLLEANKVAGSIQSESPPNEGALEAMDKSMETNMMKAEAMYIGSYNHLKVELKHALSSFVHSQVQPMILKSVMEKIYEATHPTAWSMVKKVCARPLAQLRLIGISWMPWSSWSICSVTCGSEGFHVRRRECSPDQICTGTNFDLKTCAKQEDCLGAALWLSWSLWSACFNSCGMSGRRLRFRSCLTSDPAYPCQGDYSEAMACVPPPCKGVKEAKGNGTKKKEQKTTGKKGKKNGKKKNGKKKKKGKTQPKKKGNANISINITAESANPRSGRKHRRDSDGWISAENINYEINRQPLSRSASGMGAMGMKDIRNTLVEIESEYQDLREDSLSRPEDPFKPLSNVQALTYDKYPNSLPTSDNSKIQPQLKEALLKETSVDNQELNEEKAQAIVDSDTDKQYVGLVDRREEEILLRAPVLKDQQLVWSAWGFWSPCSVTCGKGMQFRRRECMLRRGYNAEGLPVKDILCSGIGKEKKYCRTGTCMLSIAIPTNLVGIEENGNGIIRCKHNLKAGQVAQIYWLTPDGHRITADQQPDHYSMQNTTLVVHNAKKEDLGQYMCVLLGPNHPYVPSDWQTSQQVAWGMTIGHAAATATFNADISVVNVPKQSSCAGNPCENGGTCEAVAQPATAPGQQKRQAGGPDTFHYRCICPDGFFGVHCEQKAHVNLSRPKLKAMALIMLLIAGLFFFVVCAICISARLSSWKSEEEFGPIVSTRRKSEDQWHLMKSAKPENSKKSSKRISLEKRGSIKKVRDRLGSIFGQTEEEEKPTFGVETDDDNDDDNNQAIMTGDSHYDRPDAAKYDSIYPSYPSKQNRYASFPVNATHNASPPTVQGTLDFNEDSDYPPSVEVSRSIVCDRDSVQIITKSGREPQNDVRVHRLQSSCPSQDHIHLPPLSQRRHQFLPNINYSYPHSLVPCKSSSHTRNRRKFGSYSLPSRASSLGFESKHNETNDSLIYSRQSLHSNCDARTAEGAGQKSQSLHSFRESDKSIPNARRLSETELQHMQGSESGVNQQASQSTSRAYLGSGSSSSTTTYDKFGQPSKTTFERYEIGHPDEPYPYRETRSRHHLKENFQRLQNQPSGSSSRCNSSFSRSNADKQMYGFLSSDSKTQQQSRDRSPSPHNEHTRPARASSPQLQRTGTFCQSQTRMQNGSAVSETSGSSPHRQQSINFSPFHPRHLEGGGEGLSNAVRSDGQKSARDVLLRRAMENSYIQATSGHSGHTSVSFPEQTQSRVSKLPGERQEMDHPAATVSSEEQGKSNRAHILGRADLMLLEQKDLEAGASRGSYLHWLECWKGNGSSLYGASHPPPSIVSQSTQSTSAFPSWTTSARSSPSRPRSPMVRRTRSRSNRISSPLETGSPKQQIEVSSPEENMSDHAKACGKHVKFDDAVSQNKPHRSCDSPNVNAYFRTQDQGSTLRTEKQSKFDYQVEPSGSRLQAKAPCYVLNEDFLLPMATDKSCSMDKFYIKTSSGTTANSSNSKSNLKSSMKFQSGGQINGGQPARRVSFSEAKIISDTKCMSKMDFLMGRAGSVSQTSQDSRMGGDSLSFTSESSEQQCEDNNVYIREVVKDATSLHKRSSGFPSKDSSFNVTPVHSSHSSRGSSGMKNLDTMSVHSTQKKEKLQSSLPPMPGGARRDAGTSPRIGRYGDRSGKRESDSNCVNSLPLANASEFKFGSFKSYDSSIWTPAYVHKGGNTSTVNSISSEHCYPSNQSMKDITTQCNIRESERSQAQGLADPPLLVDLSEPEESGRSAEHKLGLAAFASQLSRQRMLSPLRPSLSRRHPLKQDNLQDSLAAKISQFDSQAQFFHELTQRASLAATGSTSDTSDPPSSDNPTSSAVLSNSSELDTLCQQLDNDMSFDSFQELLARRIPEAFFKPINKEDSSQNSH